MPDGTMLNTIELSSAPAPVIEALDVSAISVEGAARADGLVRLRGMQTRIRAFVEARRDELYGAYRATVTAHVTPEALVDAAGAFKKKRLAEWELLGPHIQQIQRNLLRRSQNDTEVVEVLQRIVDAAVEFTALYDWASDITLTLAAQLLDGSNAELRARPVKGEIDYAELSREHIARYPKIRARLAE